MFKARIFRLYFKPTHTEKLNFSRFNTLDHVFKKFQAHKSARPHFWLKTFVRSSDKASVFCDGTKHVKE